VSAAGSPTVPLVEAARSLAQSHAASPAAASPRRFRQRLTRLNRTIERALPLLAAEPPPEPAAGAAEWLLDNAHLLAEALAQVHETLAPGFLRRLPALAVPASGAEPRVYALARELVREGEGHFDPDRAKRFLDAYLPAPPVTMGELWALPAMLRLVLLEELAGDAGRLVSPLPAGRGPVDPVHTGRAVQSLRVLATLSWEAFFEEVSRVHRELCSDPAGVYARMDFETRDRYRKAVERLSRRAGVPEEGVASAAVRLARSGGADPRLGHVGHWLVDRGRTALEAEIGSPPGTGERLRRALAEAGPALYLLLVGGLAAAFLLGLASPALRGGTSPWGVAAVLILCIVPALTLATTLVNWAATHLVPPRVLPKLDFPEGVPAEHRTAVVVPVLLSDPGEVAGLLAQLELNFRGNADPNLVFALLADFTDAPEREMPGDAALLALAREGVRELNRRLGDGGAPPFLLLHRERSWNPGEGRWMGWERKRGKLAEFNRRVLGLASGVDVREGSGEALAGVRFAITLDADTLLPQGAACRLVATLAHPLNRPVLDAGGKVEAGYTVLQPRVEVLPTSAARTLFARIYEGERGLDLYSRAVSDVYQDLFGEGSFAGKGIYDVAAFHASLAGRVPPNALLSHDLFEGVHGRAGLVSDVLVFEEYPSHVLAYMRRLHRWVRGDWQLLPWLLPRVPTEGGGRVRSRLSLLDRWKIVDNLRRSLLSLSLVALLAAGWTTLPGPPAWWTGAALLVLGAPMLFGAAAAGRQWVRLRVRRFVSIRRTREAGLALVRWCAVVVLLPFEAAVEGDAVARTLWRLGVSRRHLLEWTSAAHAARAARSVDRRAPLWLRMAPAPLAALALAVLVWLVRPGALPLAAPFLAAWLLSPEIAFRLSRPRSDPEPQLRDDDARFLRALARRTWAFFDRFTGPDDHWLPPDNFQEDPPGALARRTSPTNVGLMALSTLAAHDLGYVPVSRLAARLDNTLDTLAQLERYRGHFLNWYDTHTLATLEPRYVSTVDSGNLAGCLLAVAAACREAADEPLVRPVAAAGLQDALQVLRESLPPPGRTGAGELRALAAGMEALRAEAGTPPGPREWARLLVELADRRLRAVEAGIVARVEADPERFPPRVLSLLRVWLDQVARQAAAHRSEVETLLPWLLLPDEPPAELGKGGADARVAAAWRALRDGSAAAPSLAGLADACAATEARLEALRHALRAAGESGDGALAWTDGLSARVARAAAAGRETAAELASIAERAERLVGEMDFSFLYDPGRKLFHIGYNVTAGQLDGSYYDLLASEARLASLIAVAKGEVPARHWLHLGRPLAKADGSAVLLSWGGSMFEYLLPGLLTRTPRGSLLHLAGRAAVEEQRRFARRHRVPWGVSESSYAETDSHGTYQYRAFGVPGLALRRDAGDRLVVTPYASALALGWAPREATGNLRTLAGMRMMGTYGLFEALDYGPAARLRQGEPGRVRSYMAHHQGMILVAVANFLGGDAMVERFHSHPGIAAAELLLHEHVPGRARLEPRILASAARAAPLRVPPPVHPWRVPAEGVPPRAQVLSNGTLSLLVTSWGSGGSRLRERALTRWTADPALEPWGTWIYLKDLETGALWSATAAPTHTRAEQSEVFFSPHAAEFHRREHGVSSRLSVTVAAGAPVEVRRLSLLNEGDRSRRLLVASCGEPALAPPAEDRRHPVFAKLFVESAFHPGAGVLLFRRRTATPLEETVRLGHAAVAGASARLAGWETDRRRFLGRSGSARTPAALRADPHGLSGTEGAVLDPVFALAYEIVLAPGEEAEVAFLTAAGASEAEVLARLDAYRSPGRVAWAFEEARSRSEHELHDTGVGPGDAEALQLFLSALAYPFPGPAAEPPRAGAVRPVPYQEALWGLGISGDHPVVLLRVSRAPEARLLLEQVVRAHAAWRRAGVVADLLVLDEEPGSYEQPLRDWLQPPLEETGSVHWLDRPGGVFHVAAERLGPDARAAVVGGAHLVLDAGGGPLAAQLAARTAPAVRLPAFVPVTSGPLRPEPVPGIARPAGLLFDNGFGGFTPDGREYVIHLEPGEHTPAPWINVVANPEFGFTVSEAGAGCTWSVNSGEHRLTPWSNDPVLDPPGEALYLRDEETAETWSPTPGPRPADAAYQVRHGAGYTRFLHASHGLHQELLLFVPRAETAKVARITLRNLWPRQRRITLTYYVEWVLGSTRRALSPHVVTELDSELGAILARQDFTGEFGSRVAFLASSERCHGATGDRDEFLGTPGDLSRPRALDRIGLAGAFGRGLDPCGVLQVHVDLAPGEEKTLHFLLGDGATREEARERVLRLRDPAAAGAEMQAVTAFWEELLGRVQVRTPEPAMDLLLNRWLPYQALACRVWGRTALYQSSGAFGFRDQLQDALGLLLTAPELARTHLLEAAAHQFREGDVLHWWHPHSGRGVRTRCSDDLLWLPFVVAAYVEATGDAAVLDQAVPFLEGPVLADDEVERYDGYPAAEGGSLYEHCVLALERGATRGRHGLPLIGSGDWNDAMNRVGLKGEGESVWLGWFLHVVLERFAPLCEGRGDSGRARSLRERAGELRAALEAGAWDGDWYRRAYFDDGTPLGSAERPEGRVDSLTQSWAVLSGAADPERARRAMRSVLDRLVREEDRLVLLLEPPFDRSLPSPGYIRAYPPGVRENGGQYTHAAVWVAWAAAVLGDGDRAGALFRLLNPVLRVADRSRAERYRVEPYVIAADVYGVAPHTGRGGWTWYTGSAAWLWRLGVEAILGVGRSGDHLVLRPCIPSGWREYALTYRFGRTTLHVRVENPDGASGEVAEVRLDGRPLADARIPLDDDGAEHHAVVRIGAPGAVEVPVP
jgi:cyclic beta-1,2-glucan synthetase